jgi:AcrR family transcriptional regulator
MTLLSQVSFDEVTVADIAVAAEMTPAAVYYHFAGKEQILLEGTRVFTDELVARARAGVGAKLSAAQLLTGMIAHVRAHRTVASVYFVNSAGLNLALEAQRKGVRADLAEVFTAGALQVRGRLTAAEAGVMGAALLSLFEVTSVAVLERDRSLKGLGVRGVDSVVAELADRIVGAH